MNVERYADIFEKEKNQLVTNESGLSDFSEGSVISTMLEAFARRIEQLYIDSRNGFNTNLKSIAYSIFGFAKKDGAYATGTVIFSRSKALSSRTTIPTGTEVKAGDFVYTTTQKGFIAIGAVDSSPIPVIATEIGSKYNIEKDKIITISSILSSDVVKVNNANKLTGGVDSETDTEAYNRFLNLINGLDGNNKYALVAAVSEIPGVKDVDLIEHFPPDVNGNNFTLYVNAGGEGLSSELQDKIKATVDGDGTIANPGHKATGIQWNLQSARYKSIHIVYSASCELSDQDTVTAQMNEVIENAVNNLGIGETLIVSDLLAKLKSLTFVKDCSIKEPTANVSIEPGYVAHAETITRE